MKNEEQQRNKQVTLYGKKEKNQQKNETNKKNKH